MKILSHSKLNTYLTCGKKYYYSYIERLREPITSAALLFGSALDETINEVLKDKKLENLKSVTYYQARFKTNWLTGFVNKERIELPESLVIAYADQDYDFDLLSDVDIQMIYDRAKVLVPTEALEGDKREVTKKIYGKLAAIKRKIGIENVHEDTARYINLHNWCCLLRKGEYMVSAYLSKVLPLIKEIIEVQKVIDLKNGEGDSVTGFIDCILDFGEGPVVVDLKTSATKYAWDAASTSPQLAIYSHATGIQKTAFIVMSKAMDKNKSKICSECNNNGSESRARTCDDVKNNTRCGGKWVEKVQPEANVEIIKGSINKTLEDNIIGNYEEVLKALRAEVYPRNYNNCKMYNRYCAYYNLCHKGKDSKLIKV